MARADVGERVGAILSANSEEVQLLGYGVYDGMFEHPEFEIPNPRITLDDGRVVWGVDCWWGKELAVKNKIGERRVVNAVL